MRLLLLTPSILVSLNAIPSTGVRRVLTVRGRFPVCAMLATQAVVSLAQISTSVQLARTTVTLTRLAQTLLALSRAPAMLGGPGMAFRATT